jgi:hypothetical protein
LVDPTEEILLRISFKFAINELSKFQKDSDILEKKLLGNLGAIFFLYLVKFATQINYVKI